jgi:uncharacterized membrane-anchored protein
VNKIKQFVSNLLKDYFSEDDKRELIQLLTTSLEEKVEDLIEQGTPVDQAIERSIQEFGSATDVLDAFPDKEKKRRMTIAKRRSQWLFSIIGYLLVVGLAMFFNLTFLSFFGNILWFVVVGIGTLFWPAAMAYRYHTSKR